MILQLFRPQGGVPLGLLRLCFLQFLAVMIFAEGMGSARLGHLSRSKCLLKTVMLTSDRMSVVSL